jgi:transposase-like protein
MSGVVLSFPMQRRFTDEQEHEIAAEYADGANMPELARKHECGANTINAVLRRQGVASRGKGAAKRSFRSAQEAEIVERYLSGESRTQIAKSLGVSRTPVDGVLMRHGVELRDDKLVTLSGPDHPAWKGGRWIDSQGYAHVWVAPDDSMRVMAHSGGYVLEHRLVMARAIGRPLLSHEQVHHRDTRRPKSDNALDNLELRIGAHGAGAAFCCAECGSTNIVPIEMAVPA